MTVSDPVHLSGTLLGENPQIHIGVQHGGERRTLRQNVWIDPVGVARLGTDGWEAMGPCGPLSSPPGPLSADAARGSLFRIYPPPSFAKASDLALLEGDTWVGRVKADASPLGRLGGWGARLAVRRGPYNATEDVLGVSEEVTAPGVVSDVDLWTDPGRARVRLTDALEPGPGHRLVWWAEDGEMATSDVAAQGTEDGGVWWSADIPGQDPPIIAVALAYGGQAEGPASRIGAWWAETWADSLAEAGDDDAPFLAAMMRWFHLPVLGGYAFQRVRAFVQKFPAECLAAWLLEDSPAEGLAAPPLDESWLSAVRSLFWDWRPSADQAHVVLLSLAQTAQLDEEAVCRAGTWLHRADPLLLCRVMRSWFRGYLVPAKGDAAATVYVASLLVCVGELPNVEALEATASTQLSLVAETLGVDPHFVDVGLLQRARQHLLGQPVESRARFNLGLAMGVEPFRRLLALRLLPLTLPGA
ncbi:MAG: hypothetical protein HZB55_15000 [Deltaproteobacteria bacterium]|nr:hypothetical protein [Deltaproteobacteria bacterium]